MIVLDHLDVGLQKKSIFEYNHSIPDICYHKGSLNRNFEKTLDQTMNFEKQRYLMLGLDKIYEQGFLVTLGQRFLPAFKFKLLCCKRMARHILDIFATGREMGALLLRQIHLRKYMASKTSCKLQAIPEMKVHKSRMFIVTFVCIKRDVKQNY